MWDMLKSNAWKYLAALLLILLVATLILLGTARVQIHSLEKVVKGQAEQIASLESDKATLKISLRDSLKASDDQNKKIQELVDKQKEASVLAEKAVGEARAQSEKWRKVYMGILNAPKPSEDDCKSASMTIERYRVARESEQ